MRFGEGEGTESINYQISVKSKANPGKTFSADRVCGDWKILTSWLGQYSICCCLRLISHSREAPLSIYSFIFALVFRDCPDFDEIRA
ncbi:MAG: hypothetical protein KI793_33970 [Rivularia sp. (in: Bacteria)]|nr:hypothetical protein [Rivularia sp. MS3]